MPNLLADALLDATIRCTQPLAPDWANPRAILLTGATGFLGGFLLDELLRQTEATIHCLVRAEDQTSAGQRLKTHLRSYGLWRDEWATRSTQNGRIRPLCGDLAQPRLGLSEARFALLGEEIDAIYHNGAWVNALYPYERLRAANVLGTQEVIRLAALGQTKPLHYISTLAIFLSDLHTDQLVDEARQPRFDPTLRGGYRQSKWVAEALVREAGERGLPVAIYRPGRVLGHSQSGVNGNLHDLLCKVWKGSVQLGLFPRVATQVDLTPVDYVSRGIVQLSRRPDSVDTLGRVFHFCHPQPVEWVALLEAIGALGYGLTGVTYAEWVAAVNAAAAQQPKNQLYQQLRLLLRAPIYLFAQAKPRFSGRATQEALAPLCCPAIDHRLLSTYFAWFQQTGHLPAPEKLSLL
jgi:thioester reductase-like protein